MNYDLWGRRGMRPKLRGTGGGAEGALRHGASCRGRRHYTLARPRRCGATAWWWWSGSWRRRGPLGARQTATQETDPSGPRQVPRHLLHQEQPRGGATRVSGSPPPQGMLRCCDARMLGIGCPSLSRVHGTEGWAARDSKSWSFLLRQRHYQSLTSGTSPATTGHCTQ